MLLDDVAPEMVEIEGRVFLDRFRRGPAGIADDLGTYANAVEAQRWINLVPIDDLLDQVSYDWSMDDPTIDTIAALYRRAWTAIAASKFGSATHIDVEILKDPDSGDVCLRLIQLD
jgi:hypothetical protein